MRIKTAVIDLDGTLVRCNSFTEFVKFLFRRLPSRRLAIIGIVFQRKLRQISHHQAKERIVAIAQSQLSDVDIDEFAESLTGYVNPEVMEMVSGAERKILATAAPEIYVRAFAAKMNIPEYTATRQGYEENKGTVKLESVKKMGVVFGEGTLVITDHSDDHPLMVANSGGINRLIGD